MCGIRCHIFSFCRDCHAFGKTIFREHLAPGGDRRSEETKNACDFFGASANHSDNEIIQTARPMHANSATMTVPIDQQDGFLQLLDRHAGIVRKVAASYSSSLADRHDLMQEITLQLWKAYPRYAPDRSFSTWMYRIALNVAISFLRSSSRPLRKTVPLDDIGLEIADEAAAPPETDERIAVLQRVIAALDPLNRALLLLYLDDRSYREIASILGITETNVATKLNRLKQRVRRDITQITGE